MSDLFPIGRQGKKSKRTKKPFKKVASLRKEVQAPQKSAEQELGKQQLFR